MGALKYIAGAVAAALLAGGASAQELRKDVLYTLPIESTKNRVEALHVTLVCEYLGNVDKAINLHNAKQTDMVYELGCRYVDKGAQAVSVDWLRSGYRQMLFTSAEGKYLMWGAGDHFTYVDDPA